MTPWNKSNSAHMHTHTRFKRGISESLCQTVLAQRDAEMSDTLHGQDLRLAFGCQQGRGRRPPATNSSGISCWACLRGREQKGRRGQGTSCLLLVFLLSWRRSQLCGTAAAGDFFFFFVVGGGRKRRVAFPAQDSVGKIERKPDCLLWRLSVSP